MRGARREGQGSREGFPLGWMVPSLPTRTRQVPDPILALSAALERGWGCRSLCAVPAGSRNQCTELVPGIQTASPSEGRLHPQSRTQPWGKLSWIYLEPPPLQFITPEGVPPRKSWAGPHPVPGKVRPPQDTRTHPLPLSSRPHPPLPVPLDLEEHSCAPTHPALCLSFSYTRVCRVSPWNSGWEGKNFIWKLDRSW